MTETIQDESTQSIVAALEPTLGATRAETRAIDAYRQSRCLGGKQACVLAYKWTQEDLKLAADWYKKAGLAD